MIFHEASVYFSFNCEFFYSILFIEWFCGNVWPSCILSLRRRTDRWALQFGTVAITTRLSLSLRKVSNFTVYLCSRQRFPGGKISSGNSFSFALCVVL